MFAGFLSKIAKKFRNQKTIATQTSRHRVIARRIDIQIVTPGETEKIREDILVGEQRTRLSTYLVESPTSVVAESNV